MTRQENTQICLPEQSRGNTLAVREIVRLARPHHWIKNSVILLPVIFAQKADDSHAWIAAGVAAGAFCLLSSAVYAMNDVRDRHSDRLHHQKCNRPVASGRLSPRTAILFACLCAGGALLIGCRLNRLVLATMGSYLILQVAYTFDLKKRPIADVICIATGFVLRALAGAFSIRVDASSWLIVCTFTLCLFIGFCKRWNEAVSLSDNESKAAHRKTLCAYKPELLTHLVTLSASVAIISYLLYAVHATTVQRIGSHALLYTLPVVIYGVCRLTMISMQARYSDPVAAFLMDKPLIAAAVLWIACVIIILYMGEHLNTQLCTGP